MNRSDRPDPPADKPEQSQGSIGDTIDRANQVIAGARAEIARSQALGQSLADLTRDIERVSGDENDASSVQKNGT
jgi:hypothetical protein